MDAHHDREAGSLTSAGYSFGLARPVALGYLKRGVPLGVMQARDAEAGDESAIEIEAKRLPFIS